MCVYAFHLNVAYKDKITYTLSTLLLDLLNSRSSIHLHIHQSRNNAFHYLKNVIKIIVAVHCYSDFTYKSFRTRPAFERASKVYAGASLISCTEHHRLLF